MGEDCMIALENARKIFSNLNFLWIVKTVHWELLLVLLRHSIEQKRALQDGETGRIILRGENRIPIRRDDEGMFYLILLHGGKLAEEFEKSKIN